ncbi:uncharacterized protein LOC130933977 [Arachis stenosperma]|uniref:uncharacterized protein LOC130933977 n=1 Tax=Arachis stenosperma TaxID=217475 RepID=UPI0025AD98D6|nr:uncharacterized protein LOC130933977 [Arachis stenosperma]
MGDGEARSDGDTHNRDVCEEVHDADTVEQSQPRQASELPGGPKADFETSAEAPQPDDVNAVKGDPIQSEEDWSFPKIGLIVKDLMRGFVEKVLVRFYSLAMYVTCHVEGSREGDRQRSCGNLRENHRVVGFRGETDGQSTPQSKKVASGIASGTPIVPDPPENSTPPLAGTDSIMRKLFRTPPSTTRNAKRRRSGDGTDSSMRSGSSREKSAHSTSKKMRFKITPAMDFNNRQSALFAYVFDGNLDPCEELVRIGVKSADRVDLHSLLPGNDVDDKIIHLVAMTMTCAKILATSPAYWYLPPFVSDDILNGETTELMLNRYMENWMRPSRFLELIYDPMQDALGHWFLMLVSLKDKAINNLDSSLNQFETPHREDRIRKTARVLYNVTQAVYEKHFMPLPSNFGDFPIRSPIGIPNCGQSMNSGIWVIGWLNMGDKFNPIMDGILRENEIRATTAVNLTSTPFNKLRDRVLGKAELWRMKTKKNT